MKIVFENSTIACCFAVEEEYNGCLYASVVKKSNSGLTSGNCLLTSKIRTIAAPFCLASMILAAMVACDVHRWIISSFAATTLQLLSNSKKETTMEA